MRITSILYVLKRSFDQTKLSLFLLSFLIFFIYWTTVQPIQVVIISSVYYLSSIVLWVFSCHICVVGFWPVCLHWSGQHSLILKIFPVCVRKLSVGCIQTGHTYLLPLRVCGRLWLGWWLGVQTCLLQLIHLLYLKYPSSFLFTHFFIVYLCVS